LSPDDFGNLTFLPREYDCAKEQSIVLPTGVAIVDKTPQLVVVDGVKVMIFERSTTSNEVSGYG